MTPFEEDAIKLLTAMASKDLSLIEDKDFGLCYNLSKFTRFHGLFGFSNGYTLISGLCTDWGHFSGHPGHPVSFNDGSYKYEGSNLDKRASLANHLLNRINNL